MIDLPHCPLLKVTNTAHWTAHRRNKRGCSPQIGACWMDTLLAVRDDRVGWWSPFGAIVLVLGLAALLGTPLLVSDTQADRSRLVTDLLYRGFAGMLRSAASPAPGTVCRWFEEALEPMGSSDDAWSLSIKAKPKPTFLSEPSSG